MESVLVMSFESIGRTADLTTLPKSITGVCAAPGAPGGATMKSSAVCA
jgi:hypothetical protein